MKYKEEIEKRKKAELERKKLVSEGKERLAKITKLANSSWTKCQGCTEDDKNAFIIGFVLGFNSGQSNEKL